MATVQPAGDSTLLDLLGMDLGPAPAAGQPLPPAMQQPHPPMETGLLDLLGDMSQPVNPPTSNTESKCSRVIVVVYCVCVQPFLVLLHLRRMVLRLYFILKEIQSLLVQLR